MIRSVLSWLFTCAIASIYTLSWAQQTAKIPVVAVLVTHAASDDPIFDSLRAGLREYGYEEGRNIKLEFPTALGQLDKLPAIAQDLVRRNVDIIVAPNDVSTRTAMQATRTIPIVMIGTQGYDPVALGFVESLAHPGGNVTGLYGLWSELEIKRLEMLKETLPRVSRDTVLYEKAFSGSTLTEMQQPAKTLGLTLYPIVIGRPEDLDRAFQFAKRKKSGAVVLLSSPIFYTHRVRIGELSLRSRLPVITAFNPIVRAGALLSYGPDVPAGWKRSAYYVDRLLKGSKSKDLPVEQFWRFNLAVNLKTAKTLGITIPESIMIRADEMIK